MEFFLHLKMMLICQAIKSFVLVIDLVNFVKKLDKTCSSNTYVLVANTHFSLSHNFNKIKKSLYNS